MQRQTICIVPLTISSLSNKSSFFVDNFYTIFASFMIFDKRQNGIALGRNWTEQKNRCLAGLCYALIQSTITIRKEFVNNIHIEESTR